MNLDEVRDLGCAVAIPLPMDAELSKDSVAILAASAPINVLRMFAGTGEMFPALLAMVKAVFYDKEMSHGCGRSSFCVARICSTAPTSGRRTWSWLPMPA
jgi:hypothetical protein